MYSHCLATAFKIITISTMRKWVWCGMARTMGLNGNRRTIVGRPWERSIRACNVLMLYPMHDLPTIYLCIIIMYIHAHLDIE